MFTIDEVRAALPDILAEADELIVVRARLVAGAGAQQGGADVNVADLKADEARLSEIVDGWRTDGIEVKGWAPVLLDFPAEIGGREVFLCWLEGETELGWWHDPAHGFAGRRRLTDLL